jgi:hypothetical protein
MEVANPNPLYPYQQAPVTNRDLPSLVLQSRLPLVPCHHPGPGSTGSRPGAVATAVQPVGNRRPGNRSQAQVQGLGAGAGQQQSNPSIAKFILSFGRRQPPPSNLGGQSHPHRSPITTGRRYHLARPCC